MHIFYHLLEWKQIYTFIILHKKTKPDTARHRTSSGFSQIIHIFTVRISLEDSFPGMKNDRSVGPLLKLLEFLP